MSGLYNTGTVKVGVAVGVVVGGAVWRAFKGGWQKSRDERRQREELLARIAADMRQASERG